MYILTFKLHVNGRYEQILTVVTKHDHVTKIGFTKQVAMKSVKTFPND